MRASLLLLLPLCTGCGDPEEEFCLEPSAMPTESYVVVETTDGLDALDGALMEFEDDRIVFYVETDTGVATLTYAIEGTAR